MKKIIALASIIASAQVMAFDFPFFDNNKYGYNHVEDNGLFAFNPWEMYDPRWYSTEFTNMINEIDEPDFITSYQPNYYGYAPQYNFPVAPVEAK